MLNREPEPSFLEALTRLASLAPDAIAGPALDVACGNGRHALHLARLGIVTDAVDVDRDAIGRLGQLAISEILPLRATVADLETDPPPSVGRERYNLIVVVNYLHRPLCLKLIEALRPGGVLFYDTFTVDQPCFGRPTNPNFLLEHGELEQLFAGLDTLWSRDGVVGGRAARATLVARRPAEQPWLLPDDAQAKAVA